MIVIFPLGVLNPATFPIVPNTIDIEVEGLVSY